jgi:hypothetical protein
MAPRVAKNKIPPSASTDAVNLARAKITNNTRSNKQKLNKTALISSSSSLSDSSSLSRSSSSNSNRQAITDDVRVQSGQQLLVKVYEEASRSIFGKKVFIIGDKEHKLTAIFNFFTSPTKFATKPTKTISHKCIICGKSSE